LKDAKAPLGDLGTCQAFKLTMEAPLSDTLGLEISATLLARADKVIE
jgi:hypothetical protein